MTSIRSILRFGRDTRGQFGMTMAVAALPLMLGIGLAVDYSNLVNEQSGLQNSADSAVLAVAAAGRSLSDGEARRLASSYLNSNNRDGWRIQSLQREGGTVALSATKNVKLHFGGVFGRPYERVDVFAKAEVAASNLEIAMVLDTTGSMEGGKLDALKDAAKTTVNIMASKRTPNTTLRFAIVPFSTFVNVGSHLAPQFASNGSLSRRGADWLDIHGRNPASQNDLGPSVSRFALYQKLGVAWPGCVEERVAVGSNRYDVNDIASNPSRPETLFMPAFNPDEPDDAGLYPNSYLPDGTARIATGTLSERLERYGAPAGSSVPANPRDAARFILTWSAVTMDRTPQTFYSDSTQLKGPDFGCDSAPILPLTTDYRRVNQSIDGLFARGSTNIHQGVMWGWRVLSSRPPFTEGAREGARSNRKILLLLTDGANWMSNLSNALGSRYQAYGYLSEERQGRASMDAAATTAHMNGLTLSGCTNAKADGIEIFTILLELDSTSTSEMLQRCATSSEHFFDVEDRSRLRDVFERIATQVRHPRLTQ